MNIDTPVLDPESIDRLLELEMEAARTAADAFYATGAEAYPGESGPAACSSDFALMLELLRAVLQFGALQPLVDGLKWLAGVHQARGVQPAQLRSAMEQLAPFFSARLPQADAAAVLAALRKALARAEQTETSEVPAWAVAADAWPESSQFEDAILAGDRTAARKLLTECVARSSLVEAEQRLIQPALYRIGLRWQRNQVSVAQEHLASAIVQSMMSEALLKVRLPASNGHRALLACVDGNHHAIGLQMVADSLQLAGWTVQNLGPNVPTPAILAQVARHSPDLLGLSLSFPQQLVHVRDLMKRLSAGPRPRVIVGGLAVRQLERLVSASVADGFCTDAAHAVEVAESLLGRPAAA
ncbi:MAG TPA: cobalamin-dependent protein [Nevskia sp.]|nr:cobalamin-dependent protein [Nevskia sp.]